MRAFLGPCFGYVRSAMDETGALPCDWIGTDSQWDSKRRLGQNIHLLLHLIKCLLGLVKEAKDYGLGEVSIAFFVHFEDLGKGGHVDIVAEIKVVELEEAGLAAICGGPQAHGGQRMV